MKDRLNEIHRDNGLFPAELLLSIFTYLDGSTLAKCTQVCKKWAIIISYYDDVIWPNICHRDYEAANKRFWSFQFPSPPLYNREKRTWQDMYRITRNWYTGLCKGYYPPLNNNHLAFPSVVIGSPQEHGVVTDITLTYKGQLIRYNPSYHDSIGLQRLVIQDPITRQRSFLDTQSNNDEWHELARHHTILCHYTHCSTKWMATGALNGTVAIWDLSKMELVRIWQGHRGRVLCVSMNDEVVVSGGSDSMIRVWDLDSNRASNDSNNHSRPTRRGMINISSYLSSRSEWYQAVGEIAVNGQLIACAPDASGPILVFSLLTGSLVYELRASEEIPHIASAWLAEDIVLYTKICMTPFFLLTKGKLSNHHIQADTENRIKIIPSTHNVILQRTSSKENKKEPKRGYVSRLSDSSSTMAPPVAQMTPYQLYQHYQSIQHQNEKILEQDMRMPDSAACINVWNLQTGKLVYHLLPTLDNPNQGYLINDIRLSPDFSKVFASMEIRGKRGYEERLFCWDFGLKCTDDVVGPISVIEVDNTDTASRKSGKSWVCYM
ncbi:WD40-repeat-containing domain protein [Pilobolus umbonatus]|nr:WD40-repeat-containing domain protein [Pilobolus umbonatus]